MQHPIFEDNTTNTNTKPCQPYSVRRSDWNVTHERWLDGYPKLFKRDIVFAWFVVTPTTISNKSSFCKTNTPTSVATAEISKTLLLKIIFTI